jgi:hypothetical protein
MKEMQRIEVIITPRYGRLASGIESRELQVHVRYNGTDYYSTEQLLNSDAVSVLDYGLESCKRHIKDMIDKQESIQEKEPLA